MKKGVVSFNSIDESRFCNTDSLICLPYFNSKSSWGLFRRRTKLRCRKCVKYIGSVYEEIFPFALFGRRISDDSSSGCSKKYKIRISALQPSSYELDSSFITH
ncbi:hypothetical protein HPP92_015766 [Vanilla planifolia]|uniref:Uncharacterized protein n=1 Tax=Vanilla planifolia TaxID=51239 RepID=A0A835QQ36_VANPL|nr:hypothetical protein HPP92_015766 [Vanilla planifolia]